MSSIPDIAGGKVGALTLATEITARRAAEQALKAAEARFRDLIESAPDAVVIVNADGTVVLVNAQTEMLLGYTREELLGMPVDSLLSVGIGDLRGDRRQEDAAAPGARPTGELTRACALRKDGTKAVVEIRAVSLDGPQGTHACVWIQTVSVRGELEQADERLRALVDSSDDAIIDKQLDGTIVGWNAGAERIYGYGAQEAIGRPVSILVAPERSDELAAILKRIAAGERIDHYEIDRVCKDGRRVEVSISVSPINDQHGAIIGAATIARDVTERKRAEDNIRMVLEAMPDAIVVVADDGRIQIVNRATEELFGYARDELLGQKVDLLLEGGLGEAYRDLRQGSLSGPDVRSVGATTAVTALRKDGSEVLVEIVVGPLATPRGTLACASIRDVSVRGEMETANQWLRAIVRSSGDAIVGTDLQGTIVSWNPGAERLYGYSAEDAIGKSATIVASPDGPGDQTRVLKRVQSGEHLEHYQGVRRRKDGRRVEISATVSPIYDLQGSPVGQAAVARDVTEQNRAKENFRVVLESAPDAIVIVNTDGEIVLVNAQTEKLFGYAREELLGQRLEMLVPDRFRDRHDDHRSVYRTDPRTRAMGAGLELFARRRDGSEFPVEISLSPLKSDDGTLISSAIRDISDRKQIENELRHSRERLAEAERVARTGSWEWHLADDHLTWSDGLFNIYGLTPHKFVRVQGVGG